MGILDLPGDVMEKIVVESGFALWGVSKQFRQVYSVEVICEILERQYGLCKGLGLVCERFDSGLVMCMLRRCDEAGFLVEYASKVLVSSVRAGQIEVCKLLLENGARADEFESISLAMAVEFNSMELCRLLIEHGGKADDFESDALYGAVKNENIEICKVLLDRGVCGDHVAKANARNNEILRLAVSKGNLEICKMLLDRGVCGDHVAVVGFIHFHLAVEGGFEDISRMLQGFI